MGLKLRQLPALGDAPSLREEETGHNSEAREGSLSPSSLGLLGDWVWAEVPCRCRLVRMGQGGYRAGNRQKLKSEARSKADTQIASRCVNICSTSLITREMPIKATLHITPVKTVKRLQIAHAGENVEIRGPGALLMGL